MAEGAPLREGRVVASFGRHVSVEASDGLVRTCHPRGKKNEAVVGDHVLWMASADEGTIERIAPRRNLFFRQDAMRTKSFAANLDLILILIAPRPGFSEDQLARALIAAEAQRITPLIVMNKSDLGLEFDVSFERLAPYRAMGYEVMRLTLKSATDSGLPMLRQRLARQAVLVLGPSGSGKSSLINRLVPGTNAQTATLSTALQSGRHTTTRTTWHWLDRDEGSALIDSPGFQAFGLNHIEPSQLAQCMPDFRPHLGHCRFHNCSHVHEPDCGVLQALALPAHEGGISRSRHLIYVQLLKELSDGPRY